jgi:DNA polymerase elongation subunit (family B)
MLRFQVSDWYVDTEEEDEHDEQLYQIYAFGRTKEMESVCLKIENYTPFFYIEIPDRWGKYDISRFVGIIQSRANRRADFKGDMIEESLVDYQVVHKKKFYGFDGEQKHKFLMLVFKNETAFKYYRSVLYKPFTSTLLHLRDYKFQLYESKMDPLLRFFHVQNISSTGWIEVDETKLEKLPNTSHSNHCFLVDWKNVKGYDCEDRLEMIIAAFDIECKSSDDKFPQPERPGDNVIQIGITLSKYGKQGCHRKILLSLKDTAEIDGVEVHSFKSEKDLLLAFTDMMVKLEPDYLTGYNIYGFDFRYLHDRAKMLHIERHFAKMSRLINHRCKYDEIQLSSSGLGDNLLKLYVIPGIVSFDLQKIVQRDYRLESQKLDFVASSFIKDKIEDLKVILKGKKQWVVDLKIKKDQGLRQFDFISIMVDDGLSPDRFGQNLKFKVLRILEKEGGKYFRIKMSKERYEELEDLRKSGEYKFFWAMVKDDIHHTEIFKCFDGNENDRAKIGKYCIKDCELCNILTGKLDVVTNSTSMAGLCSVPISYINWRGQGIKLFSLVAKKCRQQGYLIKDLEKEDGGKYEGAHVFEPERGIHEDPIVTLDYNSLYPKSMCEGELTHERYVDNPKYDNLPGYDYYDVKFSDKDTGEKIHYRFARKKRKEPGPQGEHPDYEPGIIPSILLELLNARDAYKARLKNEKDPFKAMVLDGQQLSCKLTANSLYGQTGTKTSKIRCIPIARSTTAIGRKRLFFAQDIVEKNFKGSKVVYGDTDSIFIKFAYPKELSPRDKRLLAIKWGKEAATMINSELPWPQKIVYEKSLHPLILLNKKKYVGMLYEDSPDECYQKNMGIVLKRRDNAPIVKVVVGGIVRSLLKGQTDDVIIGDIDKSLNKMLSGGYSLEKYIITKTLKGKYKDPMKVTHKVLADRMKMRDPGTAPQVNDRIPHVYIVNPAARRKKKLQGDMVEHPDYIKLHKLKVNYYHYLTNQIIKPSIEFLQCKFKEPHRLFSKHLRQAGAKLNEVEECKNAFGFRETKGPPEFIFWS